MASTAPEATVSATSRRSRTHSRSELLAMLDADGTSNLIGVSDNGSSPSDFLAMTTACPFGIEMSSRLSHIRSSRQREDPVPASVSANADCPLPGSARTVKHQSYQGVSLERITSRATVTPDEAPRAARAFFDSRWRPDEVLADGRTEVVAAVM